MASAMENILRFGGGLAGGDNLAMRTADAMNPQAMERKRVLEERQRQRDALLNSGALGNLQIPNLDAEAFIRQGGDIGTLGTLQDLVTPKLSKFEENLQTLQFLNQLPPEQQEMYKGLFGKGGTTVNVGGTQSPFQEKFQENLGKGMADLVIKLNEEAGDYLSQSRSAEQALDILESNPNLDINPLAPISNDVKSLFADWLDEDALKNVSDFQQLDSQLIRNRFDVTKVLKGAITEQEQEAAQRVAGSPTGTREGLTKTLRNNIAYATLQADYNQRKADYIRQVGSDYSDREFEQFYKALGKSGQRPTLDSLLGIQSERSSVTGTIPPTIKFLGFE